MKRLLCSVLASMMLLVGVAFASDSPPNCPSLLPAPQEVLSVESDFYFMGMQPMAIYDPMMNDDPFTTNGAGVQVIVLYFEPVRSDSCYERILIVLDGTTGSNVMMVAGMKYGKMIFYRYNTNCNEWELWGEPMDTPRTTEQSNTCS